MDQKSYENAKQVFGEEAGPWVVGMLCVHDESLGTPAGWARLLALTTYVLPDMLAADVAASLRHFQASPARGEISAALSTWQDYIFDDAISTGLLDVDGEDDDQNLAFSIALLRALEEAFESQRSEDDPLRAQMLALLSGVTAVNLGEGDEADFTLIRPLTTGAPN